jgi:exonuclease SbcC
MINEVELINFQKHKKSVLKFAKGLNIITGQSDQGKSAIIHSLYWLFFNKPSGTEFVNWDSNECSVKATIGNDTITRMRTNSTNSYKVNDVDFDAVRSNVPDEIREIINITETNVHLQDDAYFLLSQQPGELARMLNNVVGLTKIDSSMKYVNQIITAQRTAIKFISNEIKEKEKEVLKYKKLDKIESLHETYLIKIDEHNTLNDKLDKILRFTKQFKSFDSIMEKEVPINQLASTLDSLEQLISKAEQTAKQSAKINKAIAQLTNEQKRINNLQLELKNTAIQYEKLKKQLKICPLCEQPFAN